MSQITLIGGGVIGLSIARELALAGVDVRLFDRQEFGREASWAGAGMLPPGHAAPASEPFTQLCLATHRLWPQLSEQLRETTGIDNGFRKSGGILTAPRSVASRPWQQEELSKWQSCGATVEVLDTRSARELERGLHPELTDLIHLPDMWQVRNPRHIKALIADCARLGVELHPDEGVHAVQSHNGNVTHIRTQRETYPVDQVCVTAGAWSQKILANDGVDAIAVEPVRGQVVLLRMNSSPLSHIIESGRQYIVPRPDGRILIGSTEEWVGFEKKNTPTAMSELLDYAVGICPQLREASIEHSWSGLRPHAPRGLPYLCRLAEPGNLFVASGHFRYGLHQSAITGRVMKQLMLGEETDVPLDAFGVHHH